MLSMCIILFVLTLGASKSLWPTFYLHLIENASLKDVGTVVTYATTACNQLLHCIVEYMQMFYLSFAVMNVKDFGFIHQIISPSM